MKVSIAGYVTPLLLVLLTLLGAALIYGNSQPGLLLKIGSSMLSRIRASGAAVRSRLAQGSLSSGDGSGRLYRLSLASGDKGFQSARSLLLLKPRSPGQALVSIEHAGDIALCSSFGGDLSARPFERRADSALEAPLDCTLSAPTTLRQSWEFRSNLLATEVNLNAARPQTLLVSGKLHIEKLKLAGVWKILSAGKLEISQLFVSGPADLTLCSAQDAVMIGKLDGRARISVSSLLPAGLPSDWEGLRLGNSEQSLGRAKLRLLGFSSRRVDTDSE